MTLNSEKRNGRPVNGETNLKILLNNLNPLLIKGEYVFCTVDREKFNELDSVPVGLFQEEESITLLITKETADRHSLPYSHLWALITLSANSDLTAVGLLAAVTQKLASAGITVNVFSAYYHDHLFVLSHEADRAMKLLIELSDSA